MRPIFLTLLAFAGTAFGVTRTTTVNIFHLPTEIHTVTIKNVDPTATTYEYACLQTSGNHTTMLVPTSGWPMGSQSDDLDLSSTSAPTSAPTGPPNCVPYTFTQGPSTWAMTFDQPGATFSGNCTVHPDKILSTPVKDCVSTFAYSSGATNMFGKGSQPGSDPTSGMVNATAVGDASFIATSSSRDARPTIASTSHKGGAGAVARPTDVALGLGIGGAVGILGAALVL